MLTAAETALAHGVKLAVLCALAGLLARRRHASCWTFTAYLAAVLLGNSLISFWPERFYNAAFWTLKEGVYDALKLGIALEVSARTFRAFPGAGAFARTASVAVVLFTGLALVAVPASRDFMGHAAQLHPRVLSGTIWLMAIVLALALWFRVPVDPLHKAILMGFVPYLFIYSAGLNLLDLTGWEFRPWFNRLNPLAYLALACYWAWVAWRRQEEALAAEHPPVTVARP